MIELTLLQKIAIWTLPILFAITVHEVAHGWVANKLGDPTARMLGRLTLNPIKHIDPIGTILVPMVLLYLGGFIFGWAKPVPITWRNLRKPKRDVALVAAAGPMANFLMAIFWALVMKLAMFMGPKEFNLALFLLYMGRAGLLINLVLMVLNLLPVPPLDGSRIVASIATPQIAQFMQKIEIYGFFILIALLASGILSRIITPPIQFLYMTFRAILQI